MTTDLTTNALEALKKELTAKIESNDGRLTVESSYDLDYWLDQREEVEAELAKRQL